jgi:hypothetical protein
MNFYLVTINCDVYLIQCVPISDRIPHIVYHLQVKKHIIPLFTFLFLILESNCEQGTQSSSELVQGVLSFFIYLFIYLPMLSIYLHVFIFLLIFLSHFFFPTKNTKNVFVYLWQAARGIVKFLCLLNTSTFIFPVKLPWVLVNFVNKKFIFCDKLVYELII